MLKSLFLCWIVQFFLGYSTCILILHGASHIWQLALSTDFSYLGLKSKVWSSTKSQTHWTQFRIKFMITSLKDFIFNFFGSSLSILQRDVLRRGCSCPPLILGCPPFWNNRSVFEAMYSVEGPLQGPLARWDPLFSPHFYGRIVFNISIS